jgi:hypothetical protein
MRLQFITTDLIFIFYTIICIFINIVYYLDYVSTEFYNGLNYFEDNEDKYKLKSYWAYCCNNWFLFTINTLQLVLTIGVTIYNFFYFYG